MKNFKTRGLALGVILAFLVVSLSWAFAQSKPQNAKININTASSAELQSLPRIGPKVAQRIIDYRTQNGGFKKIEEIMKVQGIGEKIFSQIKDLITVGSEAQAK